MQPIKCCTINDGAVLCNTGSDYGDNCFFIHGHGGFYWTIQKLGRRVHLHGIVILSGWTSVEHISHIMDRELLPAKGGE